MKKIILLLAFIIYANFVFALPPTDQATTINQQLIQQQEQLRQHEENRQQIQDVERIRDSRVKDGVIENKDISSAINDNISCPTTFTYIILKGNNIYSSKTLNKKILKAHIGKCINKQNITDLQTQLTNFYINNGYTMARVYFDMEHISQTINSSTKEKETTFIVIIEEGKINDIISKRTIKQKTTKENKQNDINNDNTQNTFQQVSLISKFRQFRLNTQSFFAFPFKKNSAFNIKDFEQGLDQMNRLQSNNVTMEIKPAAQVEINENKNNNKTFTDLNNDSIEMGLSDIIIINNQDPTRNGVSTGKRTTFLSLNYNNSGNKNTGENNMNLNISQDNLLSINDNIYISYNESSDSLFNNIFNTNKNVLINRNDKNYSDKSINPFNNKLNFFNNDDNMLRYNKSLYTALSFPLGYWTFNGGVNYATYKTTINSLSTTFHTTGETITQSYSIDRVMYRNQTYKLNLGSNLIVRDTISYIQDLKSKTGSKRSSNVDIYFNNTIYTNLGTIIIKPSYQRGLFLFGSKTDKNIYGDDPILSNQPRLQYNVLKLYIYYNTRLNIPLLTKTQLINQENGTNIKDDKGNDIKARNQLPINYTLIFNSQYSLNTLYGVDQFSIGGEYTTRGFRELTISGDNGFYVRNDVRVNMQQLFPNFITNNVRKSNNDNDSTFTLLNKIMNYNSILLVNESLNSFLSKTYFSVFYDYGYIKDKYSDSSDIEYNSQSGSMSGIGLSLNYYGKYINWSLTYSKALHSPEYLQTRDGMEKEESSIYWRVGGSW
jgi:hemolysin activation/secretion protein